MLELVQLGQIGVSRTQSLRESKAPESEPMNHIYSALMFALILTTLPALQAQVGAGTFSFTLQSYTVQGQLANAVLHHNHIVTMRMVVNDRIQTSIGGVPITGYGDWYGALNSTALSGKIENVTGTVQACVLFLCGQATYVGNGTWVGTLSGTQGSGTFQGVIRFTNSSLPQIPVNQPFPISGTWSSTFQNSSN